MKFKRICNFIEKIHLVDRCLIIIMLILIIQSTHNLFAHEVNNTELNSIDVVFRTAMASIFGYFISANFMGIDDGGKGATSTQDERGEAMEIGVGAGDNAYEADSELQYKRDKANAQKIQVVIVSSIAIISLIALVILRDMAAQRGISGGTSGASAAISTVSQYRDFVSGCVGFLIGSATGTKKS